MKGPAKLSVKFNILITYEMSRWLEDVARTTGQGKSEAARAMLQTIMTEDFACNEPAQMPGGQGVGASASLDGRSDKCRTLTD